MQLFHGIKQYFVYVDMHVTLSGKTSIAQTTWICVAHYLVVFKTNDVKYR